MLALAVTGLATLSTTTCVDLIKHGNFISDSAANDNYDRLFFAGVNRMLWSGADCSRSTHPAGPGAALESFPRGMVDRSKTNFRVRRFQFDAGVWS